jgi:hypothetical protein
MLLGRERVAVQDALERLVAMQAQVPRPPFVGLWTRLERFEREDLLALLRTRAVVRGTALRGTIHLMTSADFVELRGAMQPALTRGMQAILQNRAMALDVNALVAEGRAFFAGAPATFDALRKELQRRYPKGDERAMAYAVRVHLPLVQVPTDVRWGFPGSADFAVADSWLGREVATTEAPPHALVRRYLAAFGPATPGDAQVWSALSGLRSVFEELRPSLVTFRDERKRELFDLPDAPRPPEDTPAPVRFLPDYDNVLLSHEDRTRIIADEHRPMVFTKNLTVAPTFLVDGFVAGSWKVERKKKTASLTLSPFGKLTRKTKEELEHEGEALLSFVEEDAETREVTFTSR